MFEAKNIEQHYSLEERLFLEKVRGFCQLVEDRYSPYLTDFLNPREIQIVKDLANYYNLKFFVSSTFDNEEYGRVILAPDYYELDEDDFEIKRLEISYARQFNKLTHPKILGALLNQLGLERQVFGDVILDEEGRVQFNIAPSNVRKEDHPSSLLNSARMLENDNYPNRECRTHTISHSLLIYLESFVFLIR